MTVYNSKEHGYLPLAPINAKASATTVHYSVFDLSHALGTTYISSASPSPTAEILALAESLQGTTSQVRPLAMPAKSDAVTSCEVTWQLQELPTDDMRAKIFRDGIFLGESPAAQAGSTSLLIGFPDPPAQTGSYIDGSSKLSPNTPVSYTVSAYNSSGESPESNSATTTPLSALKKVSSIQTGFSETLNTMLFKWEHVEGAKLYLITVIDGNSHELMWEGYAYWYESRQISYGDPNHTIRSSSPLVSGNSYLWYVVAVNSIPDPTGLLEYPRRWPDRISASASDLDSFNWIQD